MEENIKAVTGLDLSIQSEPDASVTPTEDEEGGLTCDPIQSSATAHSTQNILDQPSDVKQDLSSDLTLLQLSEKNEILLNKDDQLPSVGILIEDNNLSESQKRGDTASNINRNSIRRLSAKLNMEALLSSDDTPDLDNVVDKQIKCSEEITNTTVTPSDKLLMDSFTATVASVNVGTTTIAATTNTTTVTTTTTTTTTTANTTTSPARVALSPSEIVHKVKRIKFKGKEVPVITQNNNGPCPLLAILNALLLTVSMKLSVISNP